MVLNAEVMNANGNLNFASEYLAVRPMKRERILGGRIAGYDIPASLIQLSVTAGPIAARAIRVVIWYPATKPSSAAPRTLATKPLGWLAARCFSR